MRILEFCRTAMKAAMHEAGLTPTSWARLADVSESGVRGFLNGDAPNISLEYLEKLAAAIGKAPMDFLPPTVPPEDQSFLSEMSALDEADKELIRQYVARLTKSKGAH